MNPSQPEIFTLAPLMPAVTQEDQARADFYALIARFFLLPPDAELLQGLAQSDSLHSERIENPLDSAWEKLTAAASATEPEAVREEFSDLFIGIGNPKVNPYGSVYLAGFMMEKPLATLRSDLVQLGLSKIEGKGELEDHLGALCETMRLLVAGAKGMACQPIQVQRTFFLKHISPWYARCLDDIRRAEGANFYLHVANLAQAFFEIEFQAFEIEECIYES
jgi:TorA maturation chaperone TorD